MAFGTLFTTSDNARSTAIKAVAKANNVDLKIVEVDFAQPRTVEHLKASPLGKVPAFQGEDGFALSEAIAVAVYITSQNEKTTLLGKTKQDYASILRWLSYFNSELVPAQAGWFRPLLGLDPYNKKAVDEAAKKTNQVVGVVEEYLLRHTYLVGDRITLADLFAAGVITRGFQNVFGKQWRQEHPNVTRWYDTIINQPIYSAVAPKFEYRADPLPNVAPKKPEAPKAAPKPAAAPAAAAEDAPAPKPKHPCDLLPKSEYALDDFKRYYSNHDTPDAMKYFWETVPLEKDYSIWRVDYKYNDELTLVFMSNNLIGGFNTRLEGSRKHIFGCASVFGENNASIIRGAFVIRGQEYLPVFDVAPDYESYSFTKLDPKNPEDRQFVEDQWGWEKGIVVEGKEYPSADGKVFK